MAPGAHAMLPLDQAGWHTTKKLRVPGHMTLLPLPARPPELDPVEYPLQFLRDKGLGDRISDSYADIHHHCYDAWNEIVVQPWRIMSIGLWRRSHWF